MRPLRRPALSRSRMVRRRRAAFISILPRWLSCLGASAGNRTRFEEEWTDRGARALRIDEADPEGSFKEVAVPTITQSKFLARDF